MTFIPSKDGDPLKGNYSDGFGATEIQIKFPNEENVEGTLIWFPPSGAVSASFINFGATTGTVTGISSGNVGMYKGMIIGNKGTRMEIELYCNVWTGKCFGRGKTNKGDEFLIQR